MVCMYCAELEGLCQIRFSGTLFVLLQNDDYPEYYGALQSLLVDLL